MRQANSPRSILHRSKNVQNKNLYRSLRSGKNTIFISDTHLCHGYNEGAFDQTVRTISQWVKDGKSIDRVVFAGDLFHKFDPRYTNQFRDDQNVTEPLVEIFDRLDHAFSKLRSLKKVLGSKISLEYVFGNHERYIFNKYPFFASYFKLQFQKMGIVVKTESDQDIVTICDQSKTSLSHKPTFKVTHRIAKLFFGEDTSLFRSNQHDGNLIHNYDTNKRQIIIGAHNHIPAVFKEGKTTFVMLPAFIDLKAPNACFPPAFTVMDTSAREPRIYFVTPNGKALGFKNINA